MILITNSRARSSTSNGQGETDDHTNKSRQAECIGAATSLFKVQKRKEKKMYKHLYYLLYMIYFHSKEYCKVKYVHVELHEMGTIPSLPSPAGVLRIYHRLVYYLRNVCHTKPQILFL